jgi:hypothetical protein
MTISTAAQTLASLIFALSGLAALVNPVLFARVVGWAIGSRGTAEIRINVGALWLGAGLAALVLQSPAVFTAMGIAWLSIAACRVLAYLVDRPSERRLYWPLLAGEIVTGLLFLA